jgi:DNA-binding IclR family transcriptional regulator
MSRPHHLLAILQLFENGRPVWTVEDIGVALKIPTSTIYRHVRSLVQAGFLDPVTGAGYALGPGFIRYDRILRQNDQLIRVAEPVMKDLLARTSKHATVILCRRFKDCVMCVHEITGAAQPHGTTSYERGVAMPMFLGATSKVILANLPDRTLKSAYLANEEAIRRTLKVRDWKAFKEQFREIRRAGYALTDSEVAKGRVGLAAPISRDGQVIAGISLVAIPSKTERAKISAYIASVVAAAARISNALSKETPVVPR